MPEIVDVSMPSSRSRLASKSSFQASFGSRARTFTSNQFTSPLAGEVASSLSTVWGGGAKRRWESAGGGLEPSFPREVQDLFRCVVWRARSEQTRSQSRVVNQGMAHPIARDRVRHALVDDPALAARLLAEGAPYNTAEEILNLARETGLKPPSGAFPPALRAASPHGGEAGGDLPGERGGKLI